MTTYREGGRVVIGDREFIVPKATLRVAHEVAEIEAKAAAGEGGDAFTASAAVLHLMLKKAQPELTVDDLLDLVDLDQLGPTMEAVQAAAGFARRDPGEAARP